MVNYWKSFSVVCVSVCLHSDCTQKTGHFVQPRRFLSLEMACYTGRTTWLHNHPRLSWDVEQNMGIRGEPLTMCCPFKRQASRSPPRRPPQPHWWGQVSPLYIHVASAPSLLVKVHCALSWWLCHMMSLAMLYTHRGKADHVCTVHHCRNLVV